MGDIISYRYYMSKISSVKVRIQLCRDILFYRKLDKYLTV